MKKKRMVKNNIKINIFYYLKITRAYYHHIGGLERKATMIRTCPLNKSEKKQIYEFFFYL